MLKFRKYDNKINDVVIAKDNEELYIVEIDNLTIGYGKIIRDNKNTLDLFISEDYRGNGYGSETFVNLMNVADDNDVFYVNIHTSNIPAKRILSKNGAKHLSTSNGIVCYLIPPRKKV